MSQVLSAESTLVSAFPSTGNEHLGISNASLPTFEAKAHSLTSNLREAGEQAPTSSLKKALSALALRVSTVVTYGGPVSALQQQAHDAVEGLTPLYRPLEQRCPTVISSQRPTSHQLAELSATSLVKEAAVIAAGRGQPFAQADVDQLLAIAGQQNMDSVTVTKALGTVAHHPAMMEFRVTNVGGTWPVCVLSTQAGVHSINDVKVVTCP